MLNRASPFVWATEVFPLSSSCLSFHPTFHHHTGSMEMLSLCQHTHHAHTMPSRWRRHHKAGTTETATVGQSWRQGRKTVLKPDLELLGKLERFKKSTPLFFFPSLFEYKEKSKYFNHIIQSQYSHEVIWNLLPFFNICVGCKAILHAKESALLVCGFLSKLAEPYGKKRLHFCAGNKPVKHITSSYSVSVWSYTLAQDVVICFHWAHPV